MGIASTYGHQRHGHWPRSHWNYKHGSHSRVMTGLTMVFTCFFDELICLRGVAEPETTTHKAIRCSPDEHSPDSLTSDKERHDRFLSRTPQSSRPLSHTSGPSRQCPAIPRTCHDWGLHNAIRPETDGSRINFRGSLSKHGGAGRLCVEALGALTTTTSLTIKDRSAERLQPLTLLRLTIKTISLPVHRCSSVCYLYVYHHNRQHSRWGPLTAQPQPPRPSPCCPSTRNS